jgi:hypothetical protein
MQLILSVAATSIVEGMRFLCVHQLAVATCQCECCIAFFQAILVQVAAIDALCHLLQISFQPGLHEQAPKSVISFEDGPNVIMIPYTFELF